MESKNFFNLKSKEIGKNNSQDELKYLYKSETEKNLRLIDSGHTFFSFISGSNVIIFGSIKDYLNLSNWKFNQSSIVRISEMKYEPFKCTITKLEFLSSYVPVHVSCKKFSIAILLQKTEKLSTLQHSFDSNTQFILEEIAAVLKNRNLTFQSYFLNDFENENLQNDNFVKIFTVNSISLNDFKDKLEGLINTDRFRTQTENFLEYLMKTGINQDNSINMLKLYKLLDKNYTNLTETKLVILGDFQKNWLEEFNLNITMNDWNKKYHEIYNIGLNTAKENLIIENWIRIFKEQSMFFELPKIYLPVRQIEMGENHALILTTDGSVYGFGDGSGGATGTGIRSFHCTPIRVNFLKSDTKITIIVAGAKHSFAICDKNFVFAWGCGMHGRLGLGHERDVFQPRSIETFSNIILTQIDAGDTYSACVSSDGDLYTWGHGEYGRLGLDDIVNVPIPTKVEMFGIKVSSVKCGYYCTLIITSDNCIFTLGCKAISFTQNNIINAQYDNTPIINNLDGLFYRQIDLSNLKGELPLYALCGYQYITIFTNAPDYEDKSLNEEKFYSDGFNRMCNIYLSGSLNINIAENSNFKPFKTQYKNSFIFKEDINSLLRLLNNSKSKGENNLQSNGIKKIILSTNNTAVISKEGDLHVFGSTEYTLAQERVESYIFPVQPKGIKILSCALGLNHILILSYSNQIFAAGRNKEGQLGLGHVSGIVELSSPLQIQKLKEYSIKKCYACENYSAVLSYEGSIFLFGDISFSEHSKFQKLQLEPKKMLWGEVYEVALGPDHILMLTKHPTSKTVEIKALGNGTYGKLGDNSKDHDNKYNPVLVDIKLPYHITNKQIKLGCSKFTSACLIKEKEKTELYLWGVCLKYFFNDDQKELTKNLVKYPIELPFENSLIVSKPTKEMYFKEDIKSFAISDNLIYIINHKNELKFSGSFLTMRDRKNKSRIQNSQGYFKKICVANDHAAAISMNDKLLTWGYNISNKLGFKSNLQVIDIINDHKNNEINEYDDMDKFLVSAPTLLTEFNKIFDKIEKEQDINIEDKIQGNLVKKVNLSIEESKSSQIPRDINKINSLATKELANSNIPNTTKITKVNQDTPVENEEQKTKEIQQDNIFSSTQSLTFKFEKLEGILLEDEFYFKNQMKEILKKYEFLVDFDKITRNLKKSLHSQFNFKTADPPLSIKLKNETSSKLPFQYLKYKKNFKALLSTLHLHPCYLIKFYENKYFSDKELYKIIKQLYFNIYDNPNAQLLLITLIKMVIHCDLKKIKEKSENNNDKSKNFLENFQILKFTNDSVEMNLFARLCKFYIKNQLKFTKKLELLALFIIGNIYSKTAGKGTSIDWEKLMLLRYHPSIKGKSRDTNDLYSYYRNARIDLVFTVFKFFCELLGTNEADIDDMKNNPLFSGFNLEKKSKSDLNDLFLSLDKPIVLLISQIFKTICEFQSTNVDLANNYNVTEWLTKNFPYLIFYRLIKILEDPFKNLSINVSIMIDKFSFKSFMEKSISNFYSFSFVLKYCCVILGNPSEMGNDEIIKIVSQKFKDYNPIFFSAMKQIITRDLISITQKEKPVEFDLIILKEFFKHSLRDKIHPINFSLFHLKRLQNVIVENIDNIRILNKGFDIMDMIFFNKKQQFYIGDEFGLRNLEIDEDDDRIIQVKLKTRSLALQKVDSLMKCQNCNIILLHDFIISNESPYYKEFPFLSRSSKEGSFLKILKSCDKIVMKNEDICSFFQEQLSKKNKIEFKDNLYFLFTLLADDQKKFYIAEEDIQKPDVLINKMFEIHRNSINLIFKDYCKFIKSLYEEMKDYQEYSIRVKETLSEIKNLSPDGETTEMTHNQFTFRKNLFEKINKNFEKGYGNPDLLKYSNSFNNTTKLFRLDRQIKNMPRSKNLFLKLSKEDKKNLIPIREFPLKKLFEDKIIYRVLLEDGEPNRKYNLILLNFSSKIFKLIIQKTEINDYLLTLVKNMGRSKRFFACGQTNEIGNVKVYSMTMTNNMINEISNNYVSNKINDTTAKIGNFIEVDGKEFIKILKNLTNIALTGE